jgi:hypothetical protein
MRGTQVRNPQFGKRAAVPDYAPLRTVADARRLRDALAEAEADQRGGPTMRAHKPTADQSKRDRQHGAAFARGGDDHMFRKQAAGPAKRGITGKAQSPAPGARAAKGGKHVGAESSMGGALHLGGPRPPARGRAGEKKKERPRIRIDRVVANAKTIHSANANLLVTVDVRPRGLGQISARRWRQLLPARGQAYDCI